MSLSLAKTKKRMKNALYDMKQVKKHRPLLSRFLKCVDTPIM